MPRFSSLLDPVWTPVAEVCRRLNVSRTTVWRWRKRYPLRTTVLGNRVYVSWTDVLALFGGNENEVAVFAAAR